MNKRSTPVEPKGPKRKPCCGRNTTDSVLERLDRMDRMRHSDRIVERPLTWREHSTVRKNLNEIKIDPDS